MSSLAKQIATTRQESCNPQSKDLSDPVLALKHRLVERIADAEETHLTISASPDHWEFFAPGIRIRRLHACYGVLSYFLKLEPRSTLPAHRHPLNEECIVLQGRITIGTQPELGAGGYHLAHTGTLHASITTRHGAIIFLRGAVPEVHHVLG